LPDNYIDLIYCDILYNTGKKFKDYNDNLGTSQEAIEWYKPRLIEMKRVLKETGSIYIQCDYRLVHYLKVEMDCIFGIKNFKNDIAWIYNLADNSTSNYPKKHDNILFYSKTDTYTFNADDIRIPYSDATKKRYNGTKVGRGNKTDLNTLGKVPNNAWQDIDIERNNHIYDTQKPKKLLERVIKASSNKGDIIADFFMGSGTTGEVALELGRKFIGCDNGDKACEIAKNRIQNYPICSA